MTKDTKLSELVINKLTTAQYDAIEDKDPNQLYLVTDGGVSGFELFDHKWADHILNDMSWLQADTFSWQDGSVYSNAYTHLSDDVNNGTVQSDTIGSYTVYYMLGPDGHKVAMPDQETTVQNIYNESGVAWYYILDTANQRFKLPRTKYGFTGIRDGVGNYVPESLPNITGHFGVDDGVRGTATGAFYNGANWNYDASSNTGNGGYIEFDASRSSSTYQDNAPVQQRATQMYLYFYVGQFSQSATEQTAGLNTELFNGKVDIDLGNLDNTNNKTSFILNEKGIRTVIDTYQNGTTWYRKYSDGWVEQGGVIDNGSSPSGFSRQVTFPVAFKDTTYSCSSNAISSNPTQTGFNKNSNTVATFYSTRDGGSANARYLQWFACGYSA